MRRWPVLILAITALAACSPSDDGIDAQASRNQATVWPAPPEQARIRLVAAFGDPREVGIRRSIFGRLWGLIVGDAPRHMVRPYAIAAVGDRVAITDPGAGAVHIYDLARNAYERIEWAGKEHLQSPVGAAFVGDNLYVADSAQGSIFVFDSDGDLLRSIDGLERPTGLGWDGEAGRLYVTDTLNHKIVVLDAGGGKLFEFGGRGTEEGQFNYPSHLTLANDRLYVNDTMNFRLQSFDLEGNFVSSFGRHGDGTGDFSQPKGVALDSEGHIYVVDAMFNRVQIFNDEGAVLLAFGGDGAAPGEFWLPSGLFILENKIYVADSYNKRIQIFQYIGES